MMGDYLYEGLISTSATSIGNLETMQQLWQEDPQCRSLRARDNQTDPSLREEGEILQREMEKVLVDLRHELIASKETQQSLRDRLHAIQKEVASKDAELAKVQREYKEDHDRFRELRMEKLNLDQRLLDDQVKLADAVQDLRTLKIRFDSCDEMCSRLKLELDVVRQKLQDKENRESELDCELEDLRRQFEHEKKKLLEQRDEGMERLTAIIEDAQNERTKLRDATMKYSSELHAQTLRNSALQDNIRDMEEQSQMLQLANSELAIISARYEEVEKAFQESERRLRDANSELTMLHAKNEEQRKEFEEHNVMAERRLRDANSELTMLHAKNEEQRKEFEEYNAMAEREHSQALRHAKSELAMLNTKHGEQQKEFEEFKAKSERDYALSLHHAKSELMALNAQYDEQRREIEEYKSTYEQEHVQRLRHVESEFLMLNAKYEEQQNAFERYKVTSEREHAQALLHAKSDLIMLNAKYGEQKKAFEKYKSTSDREHLARLHHANSELVMRNEKYDEQQREFEEYKAESDREHAQRLRHANSELAILKKKWDEQQKEFEAYKTTSERRLWHANSELGTLKVKYDNHQTAFEEHKANSERELSKEKAMFEKELRECMAACIQEKLEKQKVKYESKISWMEQQSTERDESDQQMRRLVEGELQRLRKWTNEIEKRNQKGRSECKSRETEAFSNYLNDQMKLMSRRMESRVLGKAQRNNVFLQQKELKSSTLRLGNLSGLL